MSDKSAEEMVGVKSFEEWRFSIPDLVARKAVVQAIQRDAYTAGKRAGMVEAADICGKLSDKHTAIIGSSFCLDCCRAILTAAGKVGT